MITHAAWNSTAAQKILCTQASSTTLTLADRRAVALSLAQVVKLDLLGACVYKRVLWTLVDVLDDEDAVLRQTAITALEPAMTGGFGYQAAANKAGRAAAIGQWQAWVEKQNGPHPAP